MSGEEGFQSVLDYVEEDLGFATSYYNDSYLDRRISSRMRRTESTDYETYLATLKDDPVEREALLDSLSINVTGFFRNQDVWEGIRTLLRELCDRNDEVHVWSAACADGREPYSVSMLASEDPQIDACDIHVLGTDISEEALETAREGEYLSSRTVDVDKQLSYLDDYSPYIERDDPTFRVREPVKSRVKFVRHDLIRDDPIPGFDLVICRNLFIYIDNQYKEPMLRTIATSLRPDGYLVIGKSETIPPDLKSGFEVRNSRLRFYRRLNENLSR